MTSVLHPVGPEPAQTYWARRLAVLLALVAVVGLVVALVVQGSGSAVSADPGPPPPAAPAPTSPSPSVAPSPSASSATPTRTTPSPSATGSAAAGTRTGAATKAGAAASTRPSPAATATGPVACPPKELRTTLTGKQRLKPEQKATFTLSVINRSDATCVVSVTPDTFELSIYSGSDKIWSTADCATAVRKTSTKVKAEDAVEWTTTWNGKRSRPGCRTRPEVPRPGTYVATARLDGAAPVQLRMILGG